MPTRSVLVTGCSRGLGLEFAVALARAGDQVIATVRNTAKISERLRGSGVRVESLDAADPASIHTLAEKINSGPGLDLLINNAGVIGQDPTVDALSFDEFRRVFDTNVFGPAVMTRALLPALRKGKSRAVWNISSELGSIAESTPGFSYAYSASKSALNMVTARLAKDLAPDGFTVVSFCPGWNKTDMGGAQAPLDPADSIAELIATGNRLTAADSGRYMRIDGSTIPW